MLIREYNDVILGLTSPDWPWSHMNELLVPAQKALTQCDLPASGPANIWTAQLEIYSVYLQCNEEYLEGYPLMKS